MNLFDDVLFPIIYIYKQYIFYTRYLSMTYAHMYREKKAIEFKDFKSLKRIEVLLCQNSFAEP